MKTKKPKYPFGISEYLDYDECLAEKGDFEIISDHPNSVPLPQTYSSCTTSQLMDDYYQYFTVITYQSSYTMMLTQLLTLAGFSYLLPINSLVLYVFGLDNLVNLLTYINQTYFSNFTCFYREWWTLKYFLLLLSSPFGYTIYLTCPDNILKLFWICINLPSTINYLGNLTIIRKSYYYGFQYIYKIIQFLLCKKIAKIINMTSEKYLFQNPRLLANELVKLMSPLGQNQLIKFSSSSIFAFVLFYLELDGTKFYTMIARQFYFKEYFNLFKNSPKKKSIHRQYILDLIINRQWQKFSDIYTLNRLLKLYLEINSEHNGGLFHGDTNYLSVIVKSLNRLFATVALSTFLPQYPCAIIIFYVIDSTVNLCKQFKNSQNVTKIIPYKKSRFYQVYLIQLIIIIFHCAMNYFKNEFMLRMIGLEFTYVLIGNAIFLKLCVDIFNICRLHFASL